MKNPRAVSQISILGSQLGIKNSLLEAYQDCMRKPFNYLIINLSPYSSVNFKLLTNILPGEGFPIAYKILNL
jgi:hypothetical protein